MSKKTQIAKLILEMSRPELMSMTADLIDMQIEAEDDGSNWRLQTNGDFYALLRSWAKGLESME